MPFDREAENGAPRGSRYIWSHVTAIAVVACTIHVFQNHVANC